MPTMLPQKLKAIGISFLLTHCLSLVADPYEIPKYKNLFLRGGMEVFRTSENFDLDGALEDPTFQNQSTELTDYRFWVEPQWGIGEAWAIWARLGFQNSTVDSLDGYNLLSTAGLSEVYFAMKYAVSSWALLEAIGKLAVQSMEALPDELLIGDSSYDFALRFHAVQRSGRFNFLFSPGFLMRSGGYRPAATLGSGLQLNFAKGFLRAYGNLIFSIGETELLDSSLEKHDAPGTGGSYARLSGSPVGVDLGGKIGIQISTGWQLEAEVAQAVWGIRYANGLRLGLNLLLSQDFFRVEPVKRVREVPLDGASPDQF